MSVSRGFGLSRCCPLLGVLVCHGVARFWGFLSVIVLSVSRGFGLSRFCPLLGIWFVTVLSVSISRGFGLSRCCPHLQRHRRIFCLSLPASSNMCMACCVMRHLPISCHRQLATRQAFSSRSASTACVRRTPRQWKHPRTKQD